MKISALFSKCTKKVRLICLLEMGNQHKKLIKYVHLQKYLVCNHHTNNAILQILRYDGLSFTQKQSTMLSYFETSRVKSKKELYIK